MASRVTKTAQNCCFATFAIHNIIFMRGFCDRCRLQISLMSLLIQLFDNLFEFEFATQFVEPIFVLTYFQKQFVFVFRVQCACSKAWTGHLGSQGRLYAKTTDWRWISKTISFWRSDWMDCAQLTQTHAYIVPLLLICHAISISRAPFSSF